jgi:hypothetical protein
VGAGDAETAPALGRILAPRRDLGRFIGRRDHRHDEAVGTAIEQPFGVLGIVRGDAGQAGDTGGLGGGDDALALFQTDGAVLDVDAHEIDARARQRFGDLGMADRGPAGEQPFASADAPFQSGPLLRSDHGTPPVLGVRRRATPTCFSST